MTASGPGRRAWAWAALGYAAVTTAYCWPVLSSFNSRFAPDAYDPALNAWILWWDAHAPPLTARWWDAPSFWPMHGALALSEHLFGISLMTTPLLVAGAGVVAAYNTAFVAAFLLTAIATHGLAYTIGRRHDAATIAAIAFTFGLYRASQLSHLQVLWAFGVPLTLLALHRYHDTPRPRWLAVFGAAWLVQALANGYFLLFFPVLLLMWIAWFVRGPRELAAIAAAWAIASIPIVPFLAEYQRAQSSLGVLRRIQEIESFNADLTSIVSAPPVAIVWHRLSAFSGDEGRFFPGALVLALAGAGAAVSAAGLRRRPAAARSATWTIRAALGAGGFAALAAALSAVAYGPWRWVVAGRVLVSVSSAEKPLALALLLSGICALTSAAVRDARRRQSAFAFYALAAAATLLFALGPHPRLAGHPLLYRGPYWWLMQLPGFSVLRVPARFGTFVELGVTMAAALGFARLTQSRPERTRISLAITAVALILLESWPHMPVAAAPAPLPAATLPVDAAILEMPPGTTARDVTALFRSIEHRHPVVNGYSGFDPVHYLILKTALFLGDERVLDALAAERDIVLAIDDENPLRWLPLALRHRRATRLADQPGWRFVLIAKAPRLRVPAGARLQIARVDVNAQPGDAGLMLDGRATTAWSSRAPQTGSERIVVDLGAAQNVSAVRLDLGPFWPDYPRLLAIDCAADGNDWDQCWAGSPAALALEGALVDPRNPAMIAAIGRPAVRRIRLRQLGADQSNAWSIAELAVLGASRP